MPSYIRILQNQIGDWNRQHFPDQTPYQTLLGAVEEVGELAHAHLKQEQGIRGTEAEHEADAKDAVADCIIFLLQYATMRGWDVHRLLEDTWREVEKRDWSTVRAVSGGGRAIARVDIAAADLLASKYGEEG